MKFAAFVMLLVALGLALANVAWGHGFDGRSFAAVILVCVAIITWSSAPERRS